MPGRQPNEWAKALAVAAGQQVRALREERGLTGSQLSGLTRDNGLEIKAPVIYTIENGTRDFISIAEILVLAAALGTEPWALCPELAPSVAADAAARRAAVQGVQAAVAALVETIAQ